MRIQARGRVSGRLAQLALIPAVAFLLAACGTQVNDNPTSDDAFPSLFTGEVVTTQGAQAASVYLPLFLIAVAIFILVEGLLLFMAFRFRRRKADSDLPAQTHGNNKLEILWTAIPAVVVTGMFVASMAVLTEVQAKSDSPAVTIETTASQFQWKFAYPEYGFEKAVDLVDGELVQPDMVVPVNEPVRVTLTSTDVIHSFYVPMFFYKLDAIPGRVNEFEFTVEQPGTYGGQCAEFCGLQHGDMFFNVRALERGEFDAWVNAEVAAAEAASSPEPAVTAEPGATGAPEGALLQISSVQEEPIAFTETTLEARAGETVTVEYLNDTNVPHNIAFFEGADATAPLIANTDIETGPGALNSVTFEAPTTPGSYFFMCMVHPIQMTGTFEVVQG